MLSFFDDLFAKQEKLLILGFGKEGQSTYHYLRSNFPDVELGIADRNENLDSSKLLSADTKLELHVGADYLTALNEYGFIMKSPGIKLDRASLPSACVISSQTDLFLRHYAKHCIGVTGTKGKSTTATLIHHILQSAGRKSLLLGNIGVPAFDKLSLIDDKTLVVFELSAHQLEFIHKSPHIAVLLNIYPEHLDHFDSFEKYNEAKHNIYQYQKEGDVLIVSEDLKDAMQHSHKLAFGSVTEESVALSVSSGGFYHHKESQHIAIASDKLPLLGKHNLKNMAAALLAVNQFGLSFCEAAEYLKTFKPLPHRMELIGPIHGMRFYNDSISTVPESTIAAVRSLSPVDAIILGGFDRGLDYRELVQFLLYSKVRTFIFLGKAGDVMLRIFRKESTSTDGINLYDVSDLEEAVIKLKQLLPDGACCLLSPAAASYDQFHNFEHRGEQFKKLVIKHFS